ncbi:uncharacterized protein LOC117573148 isoform X3 [Drosophila albomicans]|uniref:Uncharacterized protein LOC117573148 isoform X3 n=1 Tax=Drosophila albomicans TaxID=7291 RepID=A0A9C6T688_DROAB|nr:uncharacterized protein LOC117573148 isoform X3 [Drosophila albomicans]
MFQMDSADFWQQARVPFALQAASTMQHQQQQQHHQLQLQLPLTHPQSNTQPSGNQQQKQQSDPATTATTTNNNHLPLNSKLQTGHLQQQHQPQQQQQQQHHQQQMQLQHQVEQQCYVSEANNFEAEQDVVTTTSTSNHHLLFNAAAAAAAAVHLKSTALNNHNQNNSNNTNSIDSHLVSSLPVKLKHEHGQLQQSDPRQQQSESETYSGSGFFGSVHMVDQQSHNKQEQDRSTTPITNANKAMSQGQQSPQHSITPSGGCSTPDIKFSNEKLANEIQLQLSRSSSAAAISERTLEECWSTLQRVSWHLFRCLFMHKSAMQQIQQQIPRVGLGAQGVATNSAANMGSSTSASGLGTETKPHQCQQCMKSFSSNHQLVQHIRVHTGEKPYKCSYCDRRFKQLSHVQQHTRLHTGERPYKCHLPDCGRAFIQLSNLQQHLRNHDAQVERAKNRPFHCNICGKGFATESSLRTHTSKQHAALIGGPNATSCPICHKLFLGTEALMDHMKLVHKEKTPPPNESSGQCNNGSQGANGNVCAGPNALASQCTSELNCGLPSTPSLHESYLGKRRTANHPCPVCGKHYVNEGSLRKHLACHAETAQLTNSLRMWPCSVCQAVFTNENGLLTHMDHMRMDPKHQFAAQYVLSRAAAEQRERDSLLAASLTSAGIRETASMLPSIGIGLSGAGGSNSLCPSPSANSECSSNGRLSSSSASDQEQDGDQGLSENENNNHNNNMTNLNNNNNSVNNNNTNNNCNSSKINLNLSELHLPNSNQFSMEHAEQLHANRMSLMAAASAAAAAVAASSHGSRSQEDSIDAVVTANSGSAVVQAAVVNLAAAMRMNNTVNPHTQQHADQQIQRQQPNQQQQAPHQHHHQHQHQNQHQIPHLPQLLSPHGGQQQTQPGSTSGTGASNNNQRSPTINVPSLQIQADNTSSVMISMMRNSLDSGLGGMHQLEPLHHHQLQSTNFAQASSLQGPPHHHPQHHHQHSHSHSHNPETTLRMHQQAEAILRSHTEAAFRLAAASVAATNVNSTAPNITSSSVPIVVKNETLSHHHQQRQVNGDIQTASANALQEVQPQQNQSNS